jgi:hypothetical protein
MQLVRDQNFNESSFGANLNKFIILGMLTSLPFLCVTFFVYAVVSELRNLPGKVLLCYLAALISSFLSLSISQLKIIEHSSVPCRILGYWLYWSLMTAFFWLHIICFDIWLQITTKIKLLEKRKELSRFRKYISYGFGIPIVLVIIAYMVDNSNTDVIWKPNIGIESCFLKGALMRLFNFPLFLFALIFRTVDDNTNLFPWSNRDNIFIKYLLLHRYWNQYLQIEERIR